MARLLLNQTCYDAVRPRGAPESDYVRLLLSGADLLFPGFITVALGERVRSERGLAYVHMVLVADDYSAWWLAIVEAGTPPQTELLDNQVDACCGALYDKEFAQSLATKDPRLDTDRLLQLMERESPGVFFILAHVPPPSYYSRDGVLVGIAEMFRAAQGSEALRVNGQHPELPLLKVGVCVRCDFQAGMLKFTSAIEPRPTFPERVDIETYGTIAKWALFEDAGSLYFLVPPGVRLAVEQQTFVLRKTRSGNLRFTNE